MNETSAGLPAVPSLAFVHIPIPQVGAFGQEAQWAAAIGCLEEHHTHTPPCPASLLAILC